MKNLIHLSLLACLISTTSIAAALKTQSNTTSNTKPTTKIDIETGAEYDSNLSVIELDQSSSEGDWAYLLNANISSQWQANEKLKLKGGASYNSKTYQDYSEFDLDIKQAFADASYNFQPVTLGLSYHYADAELDGKDFLTLQQQSVYISRLINQKIFLRVAINNQDKDFPVDNNRNADNQSFTGDVFFFFNQGKSFLTLGISNETENARVNEFDYDGINFRTSFNHQFQAWNKKNRLQLGWRFDNRDYSATTPVLDEERKDERRIASLEWQIETNEWLSVIAKLEAGDYDSNLAAANYSETISSLTLKASF